MCVLLLAFQFICLNAAYDLVGYFVLLIDLLLDVIPVRAEENHKLDVIII